MLRTEKISTNLPLPQQQEVNNVAVAVEVHYNENNINNNEDRTADRTVALDMAKLTSGAPG